jgi:hypothetical protein
MERLSMVVARLTSPSSPSSLPTKPENASLRQALADRLTLSEAVEVVGKMLAARGSGQPHNPTGYIGALSAALMEYPRQIALQCAEPLKGVCRETRFLPEIADIVAWCEPRTNEMRRPIDEEERDRAFAARRRQMAEEAQRWEEVRKRRLSADEMKAKYGPSWGISQPAEDPVLREANARLLAEGNERELLRQYAAAGLEPQRASDGTPISLSLVKLCVPSARRRPMRQPQQRRAVHRTARQGGRRYGRR